MHRHPSLGVEYEALDVVDVGEDSAHKGNRLIELHIAFSLGAELRLLTLHRSVSTLKLAELREGLQ